MGDLAHHMGLPRLTASGIALVVIRSVGDVYAGPIRDGYAGPVRVPHATNERVPKAAGRSNGL